MEISKQFIRSESESLDDIKSYLEGKVFHVTKMVCLPSIIECGEIRANPDGKLPPTFGLYNGFFRNRNCVSLFDYRSEPTEKIKDFRSRCYPFQPALPPTGCIAILIMNSKIYDDLIPWTLWKTEKAYREQIVPYVEAGYPEAIPLTHVEEIMSVQLVEDPDSIVAILRRKNKSSG